jgi:hypothetical protein
MQRSSSQEALITSYSLRKKRRKEKEKEKKEGNKHTQQEI